MGLSKLASFQKAIIEDVLNDYVLGKLASLRKMKPHELTFFDKPDTGPASMEMVDMHCELAMDYLASLDLAIPNMKIHQEVIITLVKRYALLGEKPSSRQIKDFAGKEAGNLRVMLVHALNLCKRSSSSKSAKVTFLKKFVLDIKSRAGGDPEAGVKAALESAIDQDSGSSCVTTPSSAASRSPKEDVTMEKSTSKVSPDEVETQLVGMLEIIGISEPGESEDPCMVAHDDGARRQAEKDRAPLEAERPQIDKKLDAAADDALMEGKDVFEESKDPYQAQLAKTRSSKIASAEKLVERAAKDLKVQKIMNKRASQGKGRGRGRGRNGVSANGGTAMNTDPTHASSADVAASAGDDVEPPNPSKPPAKPTEPKKSTCAKPDSTTSPNADDEPTPTKDIETAWAEKEPILRQAGVPVELGSGKRQSYSIQPPEGSSGKSLGILWYVEQIYISKVINPGALPVGLSANRKGGVTISIKKRGGWEESFKMSKEIAGWV